MTCSPQKHIDEMKAFAEELCKHPLINHAWIDDWGNFSNFTLIISIEGERKPSTTNSLKAIVRKALKKTPAHLRDCFPPEPQREWDRFEQKMVTVGFHDSDWKFDIDYQSFDPGTNSFA